MNLIEYRHNKERGRDRDIREREERERRETSKELKGVRRSKELKGAKQEKRPKAPDFQKSSFSEPAYKGAHCFSIILAQTGS